MAWKKKCILEKNAIRSRSSFLFLMCTVIVLPWKEPLNTNPIHKDGFFLLMKKEVGFENERGAIGIEGKHRNILVILIAGILARRVVSWKQLGDPLQKGELYGMIKFGSCTELYIPGEAEICVKKGDTVRGGLTIVGRLKLE